MEIDKHMKLICIKGGYPNPSWTFDVSIMPSSPSCFFKDGTGLKYLFHSQICCVFNWSTREFIRCVNCAPPCIPHTSSDWLLSGGQKKR
jgi:hypothetical protein